MRKLWKRLFGMALCLCAAVCLMSVSASAAEHSHPVCGKTHTAIGDHTGTCNDVIWTEVTQDNVSSDGWLTLAGGESYYLGTNIAISNYITITGTVNLCLNGHSITDNGNLDIIRINPTGILTLCDCNGDNLTHTFRLTGQKWDPVDSAGSDTIEVVGGVITHTAGTNGGGVQINGGTLNLYGGSIIGSQYNDAGGGVCVTKGIFNLYGGHVTRNSGTAGGGVNVGDYYGRNSATFNMYNGTISCNTSDMRGGGVCVSKNSTFNMFNGTISGNRGSRGGSQDYGGGGVVVRGGDFLMSGGTISGNSIGDTSRGYGGGVYVYDGTFTISGNVTIKNNFRGGTLSGNVYSGGTANNVCLFDNKKITIGDALTSTDPIGVTTTTAPTEGSTIPFATAADNRITENTFTSDNRLYVVEVGTDGKSALLKVCPHTGNNNTPATCIAKAVCGTCGQEYGDLDPSNHAGALGTVWKFDGTNHWKEYTCCHARADEGNHQWDEGRETKSPTCTAEGEKTYTCSVCSGTKTEQIDALGHDFENGTWQSDEDEHWKKCSRCDVTDEANKAPHSGGTATCQAKAVCETCGTAYGALDANNHIGVLGVWQSNEDKHWKEYSCCQVHANEGNHQWDEGRETKSPTCTTAGEKTYICTDCGRTKTEQIDALGHDWGEWVVTKPATTSAAGEETRVCKRNASHTETRAIPKLTPAPSGGGSSSGSGGAPTVTVPVSGSGDTVHVSASVSGSTAEVKEIKSAELDKIGTDSTVVIDLSGLNKGVTGVTLSTDTIDSICKTEADGVTVKLPSAELRVDRQTLAAVTEQAAGSKIRLVVEPDGTARSTMTASQKSTLAGMKNAAALEAYFVSNDTRIHDFKGGSVELSIPYRAEGAIRAWFLKEDGTREPVSARYDKENAQLILHHFSHYVIEELDSSAAYTVCAKDNSCPLGAFGDLTAAAWYHDGVHYCLENGLMRGVSGGKFLPDGSTTRAQLVTILWRLEGSPEPADTVSFGDIADGAWYAKAVRWAAGSGVVKGYGNGNIGPDDAVTREQMVTILYRFAQHKGYDVSAGEDTNILSFNDTLTVSEYAIPAMQWACGSGMVNGIAQEGEMFLAPKDTTTRAQIATLMMRFQGIFTTAV